MALRSSSPTADAGAANDSRDVFELELNADETGVQPSIGIHAAADSDDYTAIVSVNSGLSLPIRPGADAKQDSTVLRLKVTPDGHSDLVKRTGRSQSGSAAQSHSWGTGLVHNSPKFNQAVGAAQRTVEHHLSQRELGRFLRSAAEEFTASQLRRNSLSVFYTPTRDLTVRRRRAESAASVQSEPPMLSSSLPADSSVPSTSGYNDGGAVATKNFTKSRIAPSDEYRIRALSGTSNRSKSGSEPLTPPPTACLRTTPFTFDSAASTDVTGAIARLAVFERDQDSDPDAD